jgi:calcineurin-like phosphoesterase family protein
MANTFFIADTHFNHTSIIKYCNRPFKDVDDQTERLIDNWNSVVDVEDEVWVLGDFFFFYNPKEWNENNTYKFVSETNECTRILNSLNGHKHLIKGNHDVRSYKQYSEMGFEFVSPYPIIYDDFFILSHDPLLLSQTTPYFNLYGHVHSDERYKDTSTSKCVSVERIGYKPISLDEIIEGIEQ